MIRMWDELVGLHFTLQGSTLEEGSLTSNQKVITRQDGLRRLIALSVPEYVDGLTLQAKVSELDEISTLAGKDYHFANYLFWCLQENRLIRFFQASEDYGNLRVFKCYVKGGGVRELVPFADYSAAQAGAEKPISVMDGPKLPFARVLPSELEFDLHVTEDGLWLASYTTELAGNNNDLVFAARELELEHDLSVNFSGKFPTVDLSVRYVDPGAPSQPLAVSVLINDDDATLLKTEALISVSLETDGVGSIVTTAAEVEAAVEADASGSRLVAVANAPGNDGTGVVTALAKKWITGWSERDNANTSFWDRGY